MSSGPDSHRKAESPHLESDGYDPARARNIRRRPVQVAEPACLWWLVHSPTMQLLRDKRVRHLPVLEGKKVIGIVSIGDLVKSIISDQKFIIEQFEHYIQR
jgi:predicted transcriptional regulator